MTTTTTLKRAMATTAGTGLLLVGLAGPAAAHTHVAVAGHHGAGQVLAHGQNHAPFTAVAGGGLRSCGGDPAAYGLETAHHGPDAGTAGKGDGCYQSDSAPLSTDIHNPHIG